MKRPPCQLATVVGVVPAKRSSVSSMLGPGCPGVWLALHEIIRWVTSWGTELPLMVQMICGWVALVTSARTYAGDGEGLASADGDAVRAAEAVGDVWTAPVLVVPQAAATVRAASASSPTLRLTR